MLNRWQRTIVDLRGNVVPYAQLQILREQTQSAPTIYRDKAGTEAIPNAIVTANQNGYAYFYAPADLYRIRSTQPTIDWRDVDIGSAAAQQLAQQALDNAVPTYETLSDMQADTSQPVPTLGRVVNDGTLENNGYYVWTGSAWDRAAYQPLTDMDVSIEPAPSKIPRATGDGVIREAWVEDLPFNLNQIYAQIWLARYPGIPAPSFYQEFGGGASLLDPRITFTRSGTATYVKNGRLLTAGVDEPVFEDGALRLEPQATNYVTYSESNFAATTTAIVQYNYAMSPDGRNNATHIYGDSSISYVRSQGEQTLNSGTSYCASVFCKPSSANSSRVAVWLPGSVFSEEGTGNGPQCRMEPDGSITTFGSPDSYGAEALGDGWYRLWVSHKAVFTDSPSQLMRFWPIFARPDEADGWLFWGMQVEEGTRPTSYIHTEGSQATRAADNLSLTGEAFQKVFNPNEGALIFRIGEGSALNAPNGGVRLTRLSSPDEALTFYNPSTVYGDLRRVRIVRPAPLVSENLFSYQVYVGDNVAIAWSANTLSLFVNGEKIGQVDVPDLTDRFSTYTAFNVENRVGINLPYLSLYTTRPTDAQMEALTSA